MKPLLISFSGGRTSAYMTKRLLDEMRDKREIAVVFANTGEEAEETLIFVNQCDLNFHFNTTWLEAVVHSEKGQGTTHRQMAYWYASRWGRPYRDGAAKYGIPNTHFPWCTRELKLRPIISYARSLGWGAGSYDTAVGIRADEIDRMSSRSKSECIIYPLIQWGVTKPDVLTWWRQQSFDLMIPEHMGNCVWCWKKSFKKLKQVANEQPEAFKFPARLEAEYGYTGPGEHKGPRTFFRDSRSTADVLRMQSEDENAGACGESCEVFADE